MEIKLSTIKDILIGMGIGMIILFIVVFFMVIKPYLNDNDLKYCYGLNTTAAVQSCIAHYKESHATPLPTLAP